MVAIITYVPSDKSSGMADYYLKPTQPEWERNQDLEYQFQPVPEHPGTVPVFQRDMPAQVVHAFRLDMTAMQADPLPQMRNLFAGLRADGGPTGKREMASYTRSDGKEFVQKKYFDVTVSNHISVGLAMANAETPAGRALIYSAAAEANAFAMDRLAERVGWTRQGAAGSGGEVRAHPLIISFPHYATRPTQSGFVAPSLHFHNIIFSPVVTDSGKVGSLWMSKFGNEAIIKTKFDYHDRFDAKLKNIGVESRREDIGAVVLSGVPNNVSEFFSQRKHEILERAKSIAHKQGKNFNEFSIPMQRKYLKYANLQTRGPLENGITDTQRWRYECMRMNWTARDLPRLAANMFHALVEANLKDEYRRTWQQTRQAIEQSKIRREPFAFNVRIKRQIVAAALALKINQFEPPKIDLVQKFKDLAKDFSANKKTIEQRLVGRKLVHSLTPALVELQRMSETTSATQTQPLQKDHESLGAYLAQKNKLPASYAAQIAAAGELVATGKMGYEDATRAIVQDKVYLYDRVNNAIGDATRFYSESEVRSAFTVVGPYRPDGPVVFASSYGDAALARDATAGKISVVSGYNDKNTNQVMQDWRDTGTKREFVRLADKDVPAPTVSLTATVRPPENAAGAQTWQDYTKSYGADAVASTMRQSYKQEFRQSQTAPTQKMSMAKD